MGKAFKIAPTDESTLSTGRDFDRAAEIRWLEKHAEEYCGNWVALLGGKLLGHAPKLHDLMLRLDEVAPGAPALLERIVEPLPEVKRALEVARNEHEPYVRRIRALLELADLRGARKLLAEARERASSEPELEKLEKLLAPPTYKLTPVRYFDRSAEYQWLKDHAMEYRGQWVAVLGSKLLGHAPDLKNLLKGLDTADPDESALLHFVEE